MQHLADLWSYDLSLVEVDKTDSILKEYEVSPHGLADGRKWLPADFEQDGKCLLVALFETCRRTPKRARLLDRMTSAYSQSDSNDPKRPSASPKR
jgi:hypothetical protein